MGCTATTAQQPQQSFADQEKDSLAEPVSKKSIVATSVHGSMAPPSSELEKRKDNEESKYYKRTWAAAITMTGAEAKQPECMGEFVKTAIVSGNFHNWNPIYRNRHGKFLFFSAELRLWLIGTNYTVSKCKLSSSYNVDAPEDSRAWKVWDGERFSSEFEVKATAQKKASTPIGDLAADQAHEIREGDFVCVRGSFKRGRVVGIVDQKRCRVRLEGPSGTHECFDFGVLRQLPECFNGRITITEERNQFDLPRGRM